MKLTTEAFRELSKQFLTTLTLEGYAQYLQELAKHYDFEYIYHHSESLELIAKNRKMNMALYVDLTVHKSRIQLRERTYRGDRQIDIKDHQLQRDHDDRRGEVIRLAFNRIAHFSK